MYFKKYLRGGGLSRSKAREILHDKTAHGKPLTEKQRKFFGAVASGYAKFDEGGEIEDEREEEGDDKEMVEGIADILRQVKSMKNRLRIAKNMMDDFEEEDVEYNKDKFLSMARIMQKGGLLTRNKRTFSFTNFLQPTSLKLPMGYEIPYSIPSTEQAMSIGGEEGQPAYLIPSFKYGEKLKDPYAEFLKTGDILGGPFKTWKEADEWDKNIRHPYVEKGQDIPSPVKWWGKDYSLPNYPEFKKGGGIPERYKNMGFTKVGTKKESNRPGKKWMVLAKKGEDYKVVHGGYKGMQDYTQHGSEDRRKNFWNRMGGKNSSKAKDPFSPLYWHKRFGTWQLGGTTYNMPFLQKENLLNQSKFSKFARGGMSGSQLFNFLFEGDDEYDDENKQTVQQNTAPSESELNKMKQENQDLLFKLDQANTRNAAFDVLNTPYNQSIYGSSYTSPDYSQYYGDKENTEESLMMENWNKNNPYNSNLSWKQNMFGSGIDPRISSRFGWRDMDKKNHNGIDIAVPMNTEIYSPISGVVNNIWNTKAGGLQVSITTPSGERFGFAHLNKTPLKIGMKINQGDFIANSGTGGTGPHLHFTVTDAKGNKVDPVKYFGTPAWNMKDHVPEYKSSKK